MGLSYDEVVNRIPFRALLLLMEMFKQDLDKEYQMLHREKRPISGFSLLNEDAVNEAEDLGVRILDRR